MSSLYIKAQDFPYYFKDEPRELTVYDSLAFVDNFGHFTQGQAGIVARTLAAEVRRLNRGIYAAKAGEWPGSTKPVESFDKWMEA